MARTYFAKVPVMVPIYSHRYLLAHPDRTGTPVLSMYQTDIIYYGTDLVDYFHHEFGRPVPTPEDHQYAAIPFWSYFLDRTSPWIGTKRSRATAVPDAGVSRGQQREPAGASAPAGPADEDEVAGHGASVRLHDSAPPSQRSCSASPTMMPSGPRT